MAQELKHLAIDEVSLVDSPANQEVLDGKRVKRAVIAFYKRDLSAGLWDSEDEVCKAVDGPDEGVDKDGKTYGGVSYPKSDFAYTPDDVPSHWKLRLTKTPGGKPDAGIVAAATAALGKGFRGKKVIIPAEALSGVKAKVRSAWSQANPDKGADEMPEVLRKGESAMTLQEIEKKLTDQETVIATLKADNEALKKAEEFSKAESETVLKMTKKERKLYASMDAEKRKAFMAADKDKRKAMMDECAATQKEKAAEDCMEDATRKRYEAAGPVEKRAILEEVMKAKKAKKGKDTEDDDQEQDDEDDDMEKRELKATVARLSDQVTKTNDRVVEITKQARLESFTKRAETELPNTPGSPVEKGEMLMGLADSLPGGESGALYKSTFASMKAADAAYKKTFSEVGKSAEASPNSGLGKFDAKVEEIAKRDNISKPRAIEKALFEAPELYQEYEHEHRMHIRGA